MPIVSIKSNAAVSNSRDVAEFFSKAHCHVLRDIDTIESKIGLKDLGWFIPTTCETKNGFGYRSWPAVDMTRDGFVLLVMGYTGRKALAC